MTAYVVTAFSDDDNEELAYGVFIVEAHSPAEARKRVLDAATWLFGTHGEDDEEEDDLGFSIEVHKLRKPDRNGVITVDTQGLG